MTVYFNNIAFHICNSTITIMTTVRKIKITSEVFFFTYAASVLT